MKKLEKILKSMKEKFTTTIQYLELRQMQQELELVVDKDTSQGLLRLYRKYQRKTKKY